MMLLLLLGTVGGFLLHQFRRITERMDEGWSNLTSYVIGVVGALPFMWLFHRRLHQSKHRCVVAYLLGFVSVGLGVAIGWLADSLYDDE